MLQLVPSTHCHPVFAAAAAASGAAAMTNVTVGCGSGLTTWHPLQDASAWLLLMLGAARMM
jgi:hypothetical protein